MLFVGLKNLIQTTSKVRHRVMIWKRVAIVGKSRYKNGKKLWNNNQSWRASSRRKFLQLCSREATGGRTQTTRFTGSSTLTENSEIWTCANLNVLLKEHIVKKHDSSATLSSSSPNDFLLSPFRPSRQPEREKKTISRLCLWLRTGDRIVLISDIAGGRIENTQQKKRQKTMLALGITLKRRKNYIHKHFASYLFLSSTYRRNSRTNFMLMFWVFTLARHTHKNIIPSAKHSTLKA